MIVIELKNNNQTLHLRSTLFWDVDPAKLDAERSKLLITERVLTRRTLGEFRQLVRFYTEEELRGTVVKIGYMDKRTLHFISEYYHIPKEKILCYRKQQSNPVHWNS
mgnify:CR=1 FL=1